MQVQPQHIGRNATHVELGLYVDLSSDKDDEQLVARQPGKGAVVSRTQKNARAQDGSEAEKFLRSIEEKHLGSPATYVEQIRSLLTTWEGRKTWSSIKNTSRTRPCKPDKNTALLDEGHKELAEFLNWNAVTYLRVLHAAFRSHEQCVVSNGQCLSSWHEKGAQVGNDQRDFLYNVLGEVGWLARHCATRWLFVSSTSPYRSPIDDRRMSHSRNPTPEDVNGSTMSQRDCDVLFSQYPGATSGGSSVQDEAETSVDKRTAESGNWLALQSQVMNAVCRALKGNVFNKTNQLALAMTVEGSAFGRLIPDLLSGKEEIKPCLERVLGATYIAGDMNMPVEALRALANSENGAWIEAIVVALLLQRTLEADWTIHALTQTKTFEEAAESTLSKQELHKVLATALQSPNSRSSRSAMRHATVEPQCREVLQIVASVVSPHIHRMFNECAELQDQKARLLFIADELFDIVFKLQAAHLWPLCLIWPRSGSVADAGTMDFRSRKGTQLDSATFAHNSKNVLFSISPAFIYIDEEWRADPSRRLICTAHRDFPSHVDWKLLAKAVVVIDL